MPKILQTISFENFKIENKKLIFNSDILVFKTSYQFPLERVKWEKLINMLSANLRNEVKKYIRWQDQHNVLLGKLLIYVAYSVLKDKKLNFENYKRDKNNKPFLENSNLNFNISHSEKTVICAISQRNIKVGIDIEKIKKIDIRNFENVFHENEFNKITQTNDLGEFYKYWARKEAFTKAVGTGITVPLDTIDTTQKVILKDKDNYYLESYKLDDFFCSLAYTQNSSIINWIEVKF